MAFKWNNKLVIFDDRNPDWKFIQTLSYDMDNSSATESISEKWQHIPSKTFHTRQLKTVYHNRRIAARRNIKPFGVMRHEDPSKFTTLGEEVFMEWNPAIFAYNKSFNKYCARKLANPLTVTEPIILRDDCTTMQPAEIDDEVNTAVIFDINQLYRPNINAHLNFKNRDHQAKSHEKPTFKSLIAAHPRTTNPGGSEHFVPRHQRVGLEEATIKLVDLGDMTDATTGDIAAFLKKYGITKFGKIVIPRDKETGRNRDIAFVNFDNLADSQHAMQIINSSRAFFGHSCVKAEVKY